MRLVRWMKALEPFISSFQYLLASAMLRGTSRRNASFEPWPPKM